MNKLYHKDIGFPKGVNLPNGFTPVMRLKYGPHAIKAAQSDRYGNLNIPSFIDIRKADLFEIEVTNNTVTKMALRIPSTPFLDLILVLNPRDGFVRTVWGNAKGDRHKTLDHSKYSKP